MFRSSLLQVVNFRSGGKSDIKKKGGKEENVFKEYLFLFLFFSFLLFLLWSGRGTSREVVPALNSLLITVFTCFLGSLLSSLTRFTENPSIYLSPPAPNSSLQNPSHFGATASHWLLYFLLFFFFFWFLTGWMCYEIAEGFRFMPLSLVRLRTFRLSTWVGWV